MTGTQKYVASATNIEIIHDTTTKDNGLTENMTTQRFCSKALPSCLMRKAGSENKTYSEQYIDYIAVGFKSATLVWIDWLDYVVPGGKYLYNYRGSVVLAEYIPAVDGTAVYIVLDQCLNVLDKHVFAVITRSFTRDFTGRHSNWLSMESLFGTKHKTVERVARNESWLDTLPASKISGSHHIHFTAREAYDAATVTGRVEITEALFLPDDSTTSFVAGIILWLASAHIDLVRSVISSGLFRQATVREYMVEAKKLSLRAKSLQNILYEDLKHLFEMDVLVNRMTGSVDWEVEKRNRTNPNVTRLPYDTVYREAVKLFSRPDATKKKPTNHSFHKFWKTRWQWSAAGSIHSQYHDDLKYLQHDRELRNKFMTLIAMPKRDMAKWLDREPEIHAWSSTKYEWGKLRAIYGTDLTSYVLAHFAYYNCEDVLPAEFPVGKKATAGYVTSIAGTITKGVIPFCLDFEDFNSQHSTSSMQAVLTAYRDVYARSVSHEQVMAMDWTIQSLNNTVIHDLSGTGTTYRANGTLLSGWRLTTFVNSVLNAIYVRSITDGDKYIIRSIHNGDDVLSGLDRLSSLPRLLKKAGDYNIRIQPAKCVVGGMAEFLRVDHLSHENGQYLARGIATLVHSRIESGLAVTARDAVEATENRLTELGGRGAPMRLTSELRSIYFDRVAVLYGLTGEDFYTIRRSHRVVGGLVDTLDGEIDKELEYTRIPPDTRLPMEVPGVADFAMHLSAELNLLDKVDELAKGIYKATLKTVVMSRTTCKLQTNKNVKKARIWRALSGSYRKQVETTNLGKARLTGFTLDVLANNKSLRFLYDYVRKWDDPLKALQVVTR